MKGKVIGPRSPKELEKVHRNAKLENKSRMPKEERKGTKEPTSNVMGQESLK